LPIASHPGNYSGNGQTINVTFHQSLINKSVIEFLNLDVSNNFTEPFPKFSGYNSSLINVTIDKIYAPNKYVEIETGTSSSEPIDHYDWAFSFEVRGNCILDNFSMCFTEDHSELKNASIGLYLYSAIWDASEQTMKPNSYITDIVDPFQIDDGVTSVWYNFTNLNLNLDISDTNNKTFFIYIHQNTASNLARVRFHYETDSGSGDNSEAWLNWGSSWSLYTYDPSLKIYLRPLNNRPKPSQIGLKINNTIVKDIDQGEGYWTNYTPISTNKDKLLFTITSNWWNVSLNITKVQINYTKTDIKATSYFKILKSGDRVQWNVSIPENVNHFDSRIPDFNTINFTIPASWLDATIKVFNNTIQIPSANIKKRLLGNGFREVQVLKATNGTNWYLTANSTNLMSSIKMYKTSTLITAANFSDIVKFNATFSKKIINGNVNLTIYSPQPRRLNHTKLLDISTQSPDSEFLVSNWTLSDNVTKYGKFQVLMSW